MNIKATQILFLSCFFTATSSNADIAPLFYCDTTDGKSVEVSGHGKKLRYRYGENLNQPEFQLEVERTLASTWQWDGTGRYINYSVTVPDGNTEYSAYFSIDRLSDTQQVHAGVQIESEGREVDSIECISDSLIQSLEGAHLVNRK